MRLIVAFFLSAYLIMGVGVVRLESASASRDVLVDMVHIPAGKFMMGCNRFGPQHGAPEHLVHLDGFMIDKYEVTNKRFEEVILEHELRRSVFSVCDDCPATRISWYEAADYCHLVGKSLPSEAQWERAAGGANGCEFPWGPEFDVKSPKGRGGLKLRDNTVPVGSFPPNRYGMHDMGGNVWEWVSDWFSGGYYFPEFLHNPRGPRSGTMKVRRGGAWSDSVVAMASGYRDWSYPFSRGFNDIGFRCAINFRVRKTNGRSDQD
ncbi:MAG: SUMF1/EgtB/PvdO family nonheme iron enzyme [Nitrospinae bacterium]|nr:SUMF1/EgtB/PvdO family nonheme iron enzyme [Nitrospinota bacterium]